MVLRSVIRRCASIHSAAKSRRCEVVRGVVERRAGAVRGAVHQTTTAKRLVVDGRASGKNSMMWRRGSGALGRSLVLAFDLRSRFGGTKRRAHVDGSHRHSSWGWTFLYSFWRQLYICTYIYIYSYDSIVRPIDRHRATNKRCGACGCLRGVSV